MSCTSRIFTRATTGFSTFTTASYSTRSSASSSSAAAAAAAARNMSGAELLHTYGPTVFKGLAVAGISGVVISRLMVRSADAEAPGDKTAGRKVFGRAGPVFTRLALESSEDVNHNTKRLTFKLPAEGDISGLPVTSALLTASWPAGQALPVLRPYTPVSPSTQRGAVELLVKCYPGGRQSTHLHALAPGDTLLVAAVVPGYRWAPNRHAAVTLVAGGAGITPCVQLLRAVLADPADRTRLRLVVGVTAPEDVLLRGALEALEARHGRERFRVVYAVSSGGAPPGGDDADRFRKGYVTEELLREVAVPPGEANTKIMVCGPPAMEEALLGKKGWGGRQEGILARLGYSKEQIHQF